MMQTGQIPSLELSLVVSNNSSSGALAYARGCGVPARHISLVTCGTEEAHTTTLLEALHSAEIDLLLLAGYMKRVPREVIREFENRVINVHPALLPAFGGPSMFGDRVHQAVLERGCKVSGATVHFVSEEYDAGPIILQECCPVLEKDSVETLRQRVQLVEHKLLAAALRLLAQDKLRVTNGKVSILE